jgi:hypothetical protein
MFAPGIVNYHQNVEVVAMPVVLSGEEVLPGFSLEIL